MRFEQLGAPWRSQIAQVELFHTCTTFLAVLGAPKSLFALLDAHGVKRSPRAPEGARPLTDPTPYRSLTEGKGGGFPLLSLSDSPSKSKYSTTANLVPRYCCGAKIQELCAKSWDFSTSIPPWHLAPFGPSVSPKLCILQPRADPRHLSRFLGAHSTRSTGSSACAGCHLVVPAAVPVKT